MGKLTTHVLDTSTGKPAAGLRIELFALGDGRTKLADVTTNADGRVDAPLLQGDSFAPGTYELLFHAGDYLQGSRNDLPDIKFLDLIPLQFGISGDGHYHVPLLLSPYGYATYRGS
jgi:5-hydroxyisourate hydrolase